MLFQLPFFRYLMSLIHSLILHLVLLVAIVVVFRLPFLNFLKSLSHSLILHLILQLAISKLVPLSLTNLIQKRILLKLTIFTKLINCWPFTERKPNYQIHLRSQRNQIQLLSEEHQSFMLGSFVGVGLFAFVLIAFLKLKERVKLPYLPDNYYRSRSQMN